MRRKRPPRGRPKIQDASGSVPRDRSEEVGALAALVAALPRELTSIAEYDLLEELGHGGMGTVYLARHRETQELVALKTIRAGELADDVERHLFRTEIEALRRLQGHPGIVPFHGSGEERGRLYYVMTPIHGQTLRARLDDFRTPDAAGRLLLRLAQTVAHAHRNGVLHRDLSPQNVLLDAEGQVYVSDFGVAKLVGEPGRTPSDALLGTFHYMAPEQASGRARDATTASDVYSLGVILYEVLAGEPPYTGNAAQVLVRLANPDVTPRRLRSGPFPVDADLESICLKCLEKDPTDRYASAAELVRDLERWAAGDPVEARPGADWRRVRRFVRNHRGASIALASGVLLVGGLICALDSSLRNLTADLIRVIARENVYAVQAEAGAVLNQLRERIPLVSAAAADPAVAELALAGPVPPPPQLLGYQEGYFDLIAVYDTSGVLTAKQPVARQAIVGRNYAWRDYFRQARERGLRGIGEAFVARSIRSENDGRYHYAIAAPIIRDGQWIGAVLATVPTDAALGPLRMIDPTDTRHIGVLLGPRDRHRDQVEDEPGDYVVLLHKGIEAGAGISVDPAFARRLEQRFGAQAAGSLAQLSPSEETALVLDDYRDPVPGFTGRWLAAFAPVGATGYIVGVQTRYDAAIEPGERWRAQLMRVIAGASALALVTLAVVLLIAAAPIQELVAPLRMHLRRTGETRRR